MKLLATFVLMMTFAVNTQAEVNTCEKSSLKLSIQSLESFIVGVEADKDDDIFPLGHLWDFGNSLGEIVSCVSNSEVPSQTGMTKKQLGKVLFLFARLDKLEAEDIRKNDIQPLLDINSIAHSADVIAANNIKISEFEKEIKENSRNRQIIIQKIYTLLKHRI